MFYLRIGGFEHLTDEQREEPKADVLYPEDERVGRADHFAINQLRHTGPQRCGHERERRAEHQDGGEGQHDAAHGAALEQRQDEGEREVTDDEQDRSEHQHRGGLAFVVDVFAEDRRDADGQEREDGKDGFGRLAAVGHVAEDKQRGDGGHEQDAFHHAPAEVARKGGDSDEEHNDVLHVSYRAGGPEAALGWRVEGDVALEHVHGVFLEREDGRIVEHAEQGHEPEAAVGEDAAEVLDVERLFGLFGLARLSIELAIHEEVGDEHDQGDEQQNHAEGYGTRHIGRRRHAGDDGREDHTGGYAEARQGHL